ncbi:MAG: sodium:solute symporter family transporter, partial [Stackebrandtia sp.]
MEDQLFDISASVLTVFAAYFIALAVLGVWIGRRPRDLGDFALGGRELSPSVTALSHGAVDYSGWLFLAFPGMVYATGIGSATWIGVGLAAGVYVNWRVVAPRLRAYTKRAGDSVTLPGYLENRFEDPTRLLRFASAAVVLVFFTIYVSSGLVAGSLLFEEAFDINSTVAMTVAMAVIVVYTAVGGFRAVSRTHVMQASLMIFALFVLALGGLILLGGFGLFADGLSTKSPALLD